MAEEELRHLDSKMKVATYSMARLLEPFSGEDLMLRENRVIFLTDAMPAGDTVIDDPVSDDITLSVLYADRSGKVSRGNFGFVFPSAEPPVFDNAAVRKAVALTRYCRTLREWLERAAVNDPGLDREIAVLDRLITQKKNE